jgi:cytoskeleton protein RodZ
VLWFVFEGRSWVEVVDGTKRMIHTGENPAGTELKLNGLPPFDIVVGNAAKVRLVYGDRPVDLAPHTRAEVARLKLE